jgi:xylitol oxidase
MFEALDGAGIDAVTGSAYSVSFFTDFQARRFTQVWVKSRPGEQPMDLRSLGASLCDVQRHPLGGGCAEASLEGLIDADNCTGQGKAGPWLHRLPHFRLDREPSASGQEVQAEYVIPREHLRAAIEAVAALGPDLKDLILVSELRTVAADDLYASPFCRRASACVHFTLRRRQEAVMALLPKIEAALQPFAPRPHWGKLFAMPRETLWTNYAGTGLEAFRALLRSRDPDGKFANAFLRQYVL